MQYQVSFGRLGRDPSPQAGAAAAKAGSRFRLALLGDFSARANSGKVATGTELAARKPLRVDVDTLDDVLARLKPSLSLPLGDDDATVQVPLASMDDFHPDQLAENLGVFEELMTLRRNLASKTGFERAAKQVLAWGGEAPLPPPPRRARGTAVAPDLKLTDFARLVGRAQTRTDAEADASALIRRLVGPYIEPKRDAQQPQLLARVDEALSAAMRRVLHHPDFQATESLWRGVDFLVRRLETDSQFHIVLYDISAEELAADLAAAETLEDSALYSLFVEQPKLDAQAGPLSALIGLYSFELTPPHADLLGRIAQIAGAAGAPFIAGIRPDGLKGPFAEQHPLIKDAFAALHALPAAAYLGLTTPRFLLRLPYGRKTDPIERFAFEEFTRQGGLGGMLWGEPALLPGLLLGAAWTRQGAQMQPGAVLTADDMPYYVYTDADGDQVALPCTERLYTEREAMRVSGYRVMPVLALRGRPEVRLGGFTSVGGGKLAGFWAPATPARSAPQPAPAAAVPAPAPTPAPAPAPVPDPEVTEPEAAAEAPAAEETPDLDALIASLSIPAETPAAPPAPDAAPDAAPEPAAAAGAAEEDPLDKLLASLNAAPAPVADDATEPDLDALIAALK